MTRQSEPLSLQGGTSEAPINPGDQLDHFRIDSVVSRGDTVTVYRGTDLNTNQTVAIKVPHSGLEGDQEFYDRFHREEEIGTSVKHRGIIKVIADHHHSRLYIVTEWFEGQTLRQILRTKEAAHTTRRRDRFADLRCAWIYSQSWHRAPQPEARKYSRR